MNAPINRSEETSRKSIQSRNPNSLFTKKNMSFDYDFITHDEFGIFRDSDGHARAMDGMDGRILQVSREEIADILQVANGPQNLFMQQRSIPDNRSAVPDEYPGANTTEIGLHQSCRPVGQASTDMVAPTSLDRVTPMSLDTALSPSIDRRYEFGHRAYDTYGARKFKWEQKDEYEVYRDEFGYARSVASEMIPVTKYNIRKFWREHPYLKRVTYVFQNMPLPSHLQD